MNQLKEKYSAVVIGGGFFGLCIAEYLARKLGDVLLCEKESELMSRASYVNQARIHNGYHYPRSILTAFRSRLNFPRFIKDFSECIDSSFEKYYAIGKTFSKVSARQYELFCNRIGAFIEIAPDEIRALFNPSMIEEVFTTHEYAFDAVILRNLMAGRIKAAGVEARLNTKALKVASEGDEGVSVEIMSDGQRETVRADHVFNCTYSQINRLLRNSGLPLIPLKHEMTEMALVELPEELRLLGITVMCGPFFSTMPFPPEKLHSLSHVRYTPHFEWYDSDDNYVDAHELFDRTDKKTAFPHIIRDVKRYLPAMEKCVYKGSLWEVKTVLPLSEVDDSRPILFKTHFGIPNLHCVMGGKLDNIYDVIDEIDKLLL